MKTELRKNLILAIFVRLGMAAVLCAALFVGVPVSPAHAATCTVTSVLDDGSPGTLRAAIADATCDTIDFDAGLSGATITLASTLTLDHDVTIDGSALAAQVSLSGGRVHMGTGVQVLSVDAGVTASLKSLILTKGFNLASKKGGGIYNAGALTLADSTLSDNNVSSFDFDVRNDSTPVDAYGGGIYNDGVLTLTNNIISGNGIAAAYDSYGGGIYNAGVLTLKNSTISGNNFGDNYDAGGCMTGYGSGIYNANRMTVTGSTISANVATTCGHDINGVDGLSNLGGGIYNAGTLTLAKSTLSDNIAGGGYPGAGAGVFNSGMLLVDASTFTNNVVNGADGGGIENVGVATVANSTFYRNLTGQFGSVGGIDNAGVLTLMNSTFSGNLDETHVDAIDDIRNAGSMYFANTIIAGAPFLGDDTHCANYGAIRSNLNNLVEDGSCSDGGVNFKKANPKLGPLADNGGPTQTMALLPGSPAINAGDDATCAAALVSSLDQRGVARPQGSHCDIGAYELLQVPKEHVRNGGFNTYAGTSKIPMGWVALNFMAGDGKDTTVMEEGTASVKMAGRAGLSKTLTQTLALSGVAGDVFTFSFWVKGSNVSVAGICQGQVLFYSNKRLVSTKTVKCPAGTYAFRKKTFNFKTSSAYTRVVIKFTYAKTGGKVWFDAVSLIE